ncbi:hypothetical protein FRC10_003296 [Ceratobasidium sp. 414]|nr:hypothetical protein FRC10_003296 [Ceratobasidium sp. 414]
MLNALSWLKEQRPALYQYLFKRIRINEKTCYCMVVTQKNEDAKKIVENEGDTAIRNSVSEQGLPVREWVVHMDHNPPRRMRTQGLWHQPPGHVYSATMPERLDDITLVNPITNPAVATNQFIKGLLFALSSLPLTFPITIQHLLPTTIITLIVSLCFQHTGQTTSNSAAPYILRDSNCSVPCKTSSSGTALSYPGGYRISNDGLTKIATGVEGMLQNDPDLDMINAMFWLRKKVPEMRKFTTGRVDEDEGANYFMIITHANDDARAIVQTPKDIAIRDQVVKLGVPVRNWVVHKNPYPARSYE